MHNIKNRMLNILVVIMHVYGKSLCFVLSFVIASPIICTHI